MTEIIPSQADLTQQFMALLPDGLAWNKSPDSNLYQACYALMGIFTDFYSSAAYLIIDAFPASTEYLLPEWESSVGLPDPCQGLAPTLAQQQGQVIARFVGLSGETVSEIINYAANLGFTITLTESSPNFADNDYATTPLYYNSNYLIVNLANTPITYFTAGNSTAGQALESTINIDVLQCELPRIIPATTTLIYNITD